MVIVVGREEGGSGSGAGGVGGEAENDLEVACKPIYSEVEEAENLDPVG